MSLSLKSTFPEFIYTNIDLSNYINTLSNGNIKYESDNNKIAFNGSNTIINISNDIQQLTIKITITQDADNIYGKETVEKQVYIINTFYNVKNQCDYKVFDCSNYTDKTINNKIIYI